jgi:hypothetical protein
MAHLLVVLKKEVYFARYLTITFNSDLLGEAVRMSSYAKSMSAQKNDTVGNKSWACVLKCSGLTKREHLTYFAVFFTVPTNLIICFSSFSITTIDTRFQPVIQCAYDLDNISLASDRPSCPYIVPLNLTDNCR